MNNIDILILFVLITIITWIIYLKIKKYKKNKGSCFSCPYNKTCNKKGSRIIKIVSCEPKKNSRDNLEE